MAAEIYFLFLVFHLVAAMLVYQDARHNSSQSAALWGLLVFFAGFVLGTLFYVLLGRDRTGSSEQRRHRRHRHRREESEEEPMTVDDSGPF